MLSNWKSGSRIQMMKLARLVRLIRLLQKIDRYAEYSSVLLALLMSAFALCAHWLACIWFVLGKSELTMNSTGKTSWIYELSEKIDIPFSTDLQSGGPSNMSIYISALYFTCSSLTSVGFGNVSPNTNSEKIFSICTMLIGALMHAAVFGNVTAIIQRMYSRKTAYQVQNQQLKDFTRVHHIPKPLKRRMLEFFQTTWSINRGINPRDVMKDFPDELRGEIALHLNREILTLSLFQSASHGCRKTLAQQIKTMFATPGEYVTYRGDAVKYIYFVCSGSLEILDDDESVVALLGKCDLFGIEISQYPSRSGFDVRSLTYCELQCLDLACLSLIFDQYPNFKKNFTDALSEELSFNIVDIAEINNFDSDYSADNTSDDPIETVLPAISEGEEEDFVDSAKSPELPSPDLPSPDNLIRKDNFVDLDLEIEKSRFYQRQTSFREKESIPQAVPKNIIKDQFWQSHTSLMESLDKSIHEKLRQKIETVQENTCSMQKQMNYLQSTVEKLSSNFELLSQLLVQQHNDKSIKPSLSYENMPYVDDSPLSEIVTSEPLSIINQGSNRICSKPAFVQSQSSCGSDIHVTFDLHPTNIEPPQSPRTINVSQKSNFSNIKVKSKILKNNSSASTPVSRKYRCSNL